MDPLYADKMDHEVFLRLLPEFVAARQHDEEMDWLFTAYVDDASSPVIAVMQRAIDRGEISNTIDPKLAADLITGPVFQSILMHGSFVEPERSGNHCAIGPRYGRTICPV
jgi:Tetracyclin repressor-like, C-terminal domain